MKVNSGDIVVADEEGIAVIPRAEQEDVYQIALARMEKEASQTLEEWQSQHHAKIEKYYKPRVLLIRTICQFFYQRRSHQIILKF